MRAGLAAEADDVVFCSSEMTTLVASARKVAGAPVNVLITGETGTGATGATGATGVIGATGAGPITTSGVRISLVRAAQA